MNTSIKAIKFFFGFVFFFFFLTKWNQFLRHEGRISYMTYVPPQISCKVLLIDILVFHSILAKFNGILYIYNIHGRYGI